MHDVFISFSSQNQDQAEYIVNQLTNVYHISCWISFRKIDPGQEFDDKIAEAIEDASIVVFVQSEASLRSRYVHDEVNYALDMNKIIIPFRIDNSELEKGLKMRLRGKERIDATVPTFDDRIADLARSIQQNITPTFPSEPRRTLASILPEQAPHFMGRDQEIEQIHEELSKHNKLFLQGFGGIGKSQLATAYAHRYREEYDTVVFAKYETSLRMLLSDDGKFAIDRFSRSTEEGDEKYFKRKMDMLRQITTPRTLIIIDNFDVNTDPDLAALREGNYTLLITTRNEHDDSLLIPTLHIHEMTEEMQLALFREYCKMFQSEKDTAEIKRILKLIGGHTLTIELVAKLMVRNRLSPELMLAQLQEGNLVALDGTVVHDDEDTVYAFVRRLFNLSALNEKELQILMDLSLMPLDGVGFDEYVDWSGQKNAGNVTSLIESGWILAKDLDENGTTQTIALHPLIAEVVEQECKPDLDKCHVMFERLVGKVDHFQYRDLDYADNEKYSSIFCAILRRLPSFDIQYDEAFHAINWVLNHTEKYAACLHLINACIQAGKKRYGEVSECVGKWYFRLCELYWYNFYLGEKKNDAYVIGQKAIDILNKTAPDSLDAIYILRSYIMHYPERYHASECQQIIKNCIDKLDKTKEQSSTFVPDKEILRGDCYNGLAKLYIETGDYAQALVYAKESYAIFEKFLGKGRFAYAWIVYPMILLSQIYAKHGQAEDALQYAQKFIKISQEYYGENHCIVINRYKYLAQVYFDLNMPEEATAALLHMKQALEDRGEEETALYQQVMMMLDQKGPGNL